MQQRHPITYHLMTALDRPSHWVAVRFKRHKQWLELSWREYYRRCEAIGLGLKALGVERGDRVAILANTRLEWAVADFGALAIGAVTVPIYQNSLPEEIEHIVQDSKPTVIVLEDESQLKKWESIAKRCKSVRHAIVMQGSDDLGEQVLAWEELSELGIATARQKPEAFRKAIEKTKLEDMATIVYTSGTTGSPRGAVLTHEQVLSEAEDLTRAFPISPMDSTLSFLPYAHVLGRIELWLHTYTGFTLNFAESIDRMKANLPETKPTVMIGVPRIFEKIYSGLLSQIEGHPVRKRVFDWVNAREGWLEKLVAERLIFSPLRQGLGGRLRFVVSGGAPLEPSLADFFRRAGLLILEGYGLTETTAAITVNTPTSYRFGTVGRPLRDVEIKLAKDGEILVKSKKVMREYFNDPEATADAFENGYFRTGDVGECTGDGFLRITDRKKDLIKTAGGKYVAPQKIEGLLKLNPLVSHALIHGDRKKYIVALLTLNESYAKTLARENGWSFRDYKSLCQSAEIQELARKVIAQANAQLASFETIKNFAILHEDFTVEGGELTASLKVKRRVLDEKYKDTIEALY